MPHARNGATPEEFLRATCHCLTDQARRMTVEKGLGEVVSISVSIGDTVHGWTVLAGSETYHISLSEVVTWIEETAWAHK